VGADYEPQAPTAIAILDRGFDDATAVLALPAADRKRLKRLRTTTGQERLNEEVRRRERVIRIFPARASLIRLLGALLMEQDEQWSTSHRSLDMRADWHWRFAQVSRIAPTPTSQNSDTGEAVEKGRPPM
jgi:putative transposase